MRLFFALEQDEQTARDIADWRDRHLPLAGRPVPTANLHITLAFLGEVSSHRLEKLCQSVDDFVQRGSSAGNVLNLDQVGYWPKPSILWLGPSKWPEALTGLAAGLGRLGSSHGSKRNRGQFQPHITLFRGCDKPPPAPTSPPNFTLNYRGFTLMESRQGRNGVTYHPLASWPL